jgi:uncharacterized protein (TIGR02271 family)
MSPVSEYPTVMSVDGAFGRVESEAAEQHEGELKVLVRFENGERLWVPADRLILQEDGSFQMQVSFAELSVQHTQPTVVARPADLDQLLATAVPMDATQVMPRVSATEQAPPPSPAPTPAAPQPADELEKPYFPPVPELPAESEPEAFDRVQVSRVVDSYREDIGVPLMREEVDIRRVPINEYVDEAPPIRYEDDRIIIPVVEEVLTVEKRLLVKEEVVVTKRRTQVADEQRVVRQRTHVVAAPVAGESAATTDEAVERFRRHYESQSHNGTRGFAYYEPAYLFGQRLQAAARYQGWEWDQLEPEARALWEHDNPGTWASVQPAVRYAWSTTAA